MLTAFFKVDSDKHSILRAIHRCDRDRFRPLVNFINGITNRTDDLNIELLGWLIDFPNRPFRAEKYPKPPGETRYEHITGYRKDIRKSVERWIINPPKIKLRKIKSWIVKVVSVANTRQKVVSAAIGALLLVLLGFYLVDGEKSTGIFIDQPAGISDGYNLVTAGSSSGDNSGVVYARCAGSSPCRACSNCSSCNWCNSGGTCGMCATTKRTAAQKRKTRCQATTKKGTQCSRAAKEGAKYCWQHGR